MDLKLIQELMNLMRKTGTKRLAIKQGEFEIELEQELKGGISSEEEYGNPMKSELDQHRVQASPSKHESSEEEAQGTYITSPMVGTFYTAPSPESPPFFKEGDQVNQGDVVCIIEAMKVMNEVKAETSGKLERILVNNGDPVEFKTKLFELVSAS